MAAYETLIINCYVKAYDDDEWFSYTIDLFGRYKELFGKIKVSASVDSRFESADIKIKKGISRPTIAIIELKADNKEWIIQDTNNWTNDIEFNYLDVTVEEGIHKTSPFRLDVVFKITWCGFVDDINSPNLYDNLKHYLYSPVFSDVKIRVQNNKEYPVHKIVLAIQSPVLENILRTTMEETNANCIFFSDIEEEVGDELVMFLYQGKLKKAHNDHKTALKLLEIGTAYKISKLSNMCSYILSNNLTVENVLNTLELSVVYESVVLQLRAIVFAVNNYNEVSKLNSFQSFSQQHPELIAKINKKFQKCRKQ